MRRSSGGSTPTRKSGRWGARPFCVARATAEYLRKRRARTTAEAYRRAYAKDRNPDEDLRSWPDEGVWPER